MILRALNAWGALAYRIRTGAWCDCESKWGLWHIADGMSKIRYCHGCGRMEVA